MKAEQLQPFALAVATRVFDESQKSQKRTSEIIGAPYTPPSKILREALIMGAAEINLKLISGQFSTKTGTQSFINAMYDSINEEAYENIANEVNGDDEDGMSGDQFRSLSKATTEGSMGLFIPESTLERNLSRKLNEFKIADELSEEKAVEPAEIYNNEDNYRELVRRSCTPTNIMEEAVRIAKLSTTANMKKFLVEIQLKNLQSLGILSPRNQAELEDFTTEISKAFDEDLSFQEQVETLTVNNRKALHILTEEKIIRFWGSEGLDLIPGQLKSELSALYTL